MKRMFFKVTSLLVIAVMLIAQAGAIEPIIHNETTEAAEAAEAAETAETVEAVEAAETAETTELGLALSDIPETISAEQTVAAEHVARLREEEQHTNTAIFRNSDGTNTMYVFSEDICYYNELGEKTDYTTQH